MKRNPKATTAARAKTKAGAKPTTGPKAAVIEVLNRARADELAAILQYMAHHYALADADYGQVAANMKLIAIDEMRHAEMLAERVFELGGLPISAPGAPTKRGQTIEQSMELGVELETNAIADYNDFIDLCRTNRDGVSAKLMEQIADEEQAHLSYFENVLEHIEKLGPAYLAQIAGGPVEAGAVATPGFVTKKGGA